jgi:hypothetical protein
MASFCNHCASDMGFPEPDIDVYEILNNLETGYSVQFWFCEGCGVCGAGKDSDDECYVLVVTDIGAGEALWIPLYEWEETLFMVRSSNAKGSDQCVDLGDKPDWLNDNTDKPKSE